MPLYLDRYLLLHIWEVMQWFYEKCFLCLRLGIPILPLCSQFIDMVFLWFLKDFTCSLHILLLTYFATDLLFPFLNLLSRSGSLASICSTLSARLPTELLLIEFFTSTVSVWFVFSIVNLFVEFHFHILYWLPYFIHSSVFIFSLYSSRHLFISFWISLKTCTIMFLNSLSEI